MAKYNGVERELPDIDTVWVDKKTHPYAVISEGAPMTFGTHFLWISPTPFAVKNDSVDGLTIVHHALSNEDTLTYRCLGNGNSWESYEPVSDASPIYGDIWTSHDLYYEDGSLYLAGEEPVTAPLDPKSMLMGWIVGRRIAGQRK